VIATAQRAGEITSGRDPDALARRTPSLPERRYLDAQAVRLRSRRLGRDPGIGGWVGELTVGVCPEDPGHREPAGTLEQAVIEHVAHENNQRPLRITSSSIV
jgi:hypothetical protein